MWAASHGFRLSHEECGMQEGASPFLRFHFSYISYPEGFSADREAPYPAGNAV